MSAARPEPVSSHTRITEQENHMTEATRIIIYLFFQLLIPRSPELKQAQRGNHIHNSTLKLTCDTNATLTVLFLVHAMVLTACHIQKIFAEHRSREVPETNDHDKSEIESTSQLRNSIARQEV